MGVENHQVLIIYIRHLSRFSYTPCKLNLFNYCAATDRCNYTQGNFFVQLTNRSIGQEGTCVTGKWSGHRVYSRTRCR
jgi:hypothetical protein